MMKFLCLFGIVLLSTLSHSQIVNVPDSNFLNALLNTNCVDTDNDGFADADADLNDDGEIQLSEAKVIIGLFVASQNISSLEGIGSFVNIERLECANNQLTDLDISQNINIKRLGAANNSLTSLNVTLNTKLEYLSCSDNQLTSLDITENLNLWLLGCTGNYLTSLNVTQNVNLRNLSCKVNQLTVLDVTQNPILVSLSCAINPISSLDVTHNPNLERLDCGLSQLTSLDVSQNPKLEYLYSAKSQLTSLDLSQNFNLTDIFVHSNDLTSLDLRNGNNANITQMTAYNNLNLNCILVDDADFANNQTCINNSIGWCVGVNTQYGEDETSCLLNVSDLETTELFLYPNPVQNTMKIESKLPIDSVQIYSLEGQLINTYFEKSNVDVSNLVSGFYFVSVLIEGKVIIKKIIKS